MDKSYTKTIKLVKEGPAVVKAGDIVCESDLEVLNPDQYICTVDEGGIIDMELTVGRGRGYQGADEHKTDIINNIAISYNQISVGVNFAKKFRLFATKS